MRVVLSAADLPDELKRREHAVRAAVALGVRNAARRGRALLVRRTPKDQGLAKQAWRDTTSVLSEMDITGRGTMAEVFNDAPYIGVIEEGARPHPVSAEGQKAIFEWVKRHLPSFIGHERAKTIKRRFASYADIEAKHIADAIVWRIRHHGQRPTYFIRDSIDELRGFVGIEVKRAVEAVANARRPA
jgi:hypothetical protein